jgi:hypothetical protein|nr:MAG TPA: tail protein [Caudoviricetes sp.]
MAMGIWLPGGGGADLDAITAESGDVLEGKVILDSEGEPLLGTMPERGDWSSSELAAGASITVPEGHHGGGGKVTAKSLSAQTPGTATAAQILSGKTAWVNGKEYTGTMPNRGGYWGWGNSKGNDGGNQRMWVRLPGGYYNENAEVYLSWADIRAMAGITPEKVKKNEWILGVQGNFEGWVPNPQDLYYNGVNSAGLILLYGWTFENTRIAFYYDSRAGSVPSFRFPNAIDVRSYSRLIFEGYFHWSADSTMYCILNNPTQVSRANFNKGATYVALDISQVVTINANATINMSLDKASGGVCYITRIRLE